MDYIKLELFKIIKVLELVINKLRLLDTIKIINKFYILLLESADAKTPLIIEILELDLETEKVLYNIETILDI